jgi:hypothetical protein
MVTLFSIISIESIAQINLEKSSINNGGTTMTGGEFSMKSSIGQVSASGMQIGGSFSLNGGFMHPQESTPQEEVIFKNSFEQ